MIPRVLPFGSPGARRRDPATSHAAAESMQDAAMRHRALILRTLRSGPMAAEQIADWLGFLDHVQVNRRLSELEKAGLVVRTEERHTNRSGRSAARYRLTAGREV